MSTIRTSVLERKGLSNYKWWLNSTCLPRNISPADIDCVLHDQQTGRFLVFEFKNGQHIPEGQKRTLRALAGVGMSVLVIDESRVTGSAETADLDSPVSICTAPSFVWVDGPLYKVVQFINTWYANVA